MTETRGLKASGESEKRGNRVAMLYSRYILSIKYIYYSRDWGIIISGGEAAYSLNPLNNYIQHIVYLRILCIQHTVQKIFTAYQLQHTVQINNAYIQDIV